MVTHGHTSAAGRGTDLTVSVLPAASQKAQDGLAQLVEIQEL